LSVGGVELVDGGVEVGLFAGAGEGDVGALLGGVFAHDKVGGVGGLALAGEGVLDVGEPQVGLVDLPAVEGDLASVWQLELQLPSACGYVGDGGGGAVG